MEGQEGSPPSPPQAEQQKGFFSRVADRFRPKQPLIEKQKEQIKKQDFLQGPKDQVDDIAEMRVARERVAKRMSTEPWMEDIVDKNDLSWKEALEVRSGEHSQEVAEAYGSMRVAVRELEKQNAEKRKEEERQNTAKRIDLVNRGNLDPNIADDALEFRQVRQNLNAEMPKPARVEAPPPPKAETPPAVPDIDNDSETKDAAKEQYQKIEAFAEDAVSQKILNVIPDTDPNSDSLNIANYSKRYAGKVKDEDNQIVRISVQTALDRAPEKRAKTDIGENKNITDLAVIWFWDQNQAERFVLSTGGEMYRGIANKRKPDGEWDFVYNKLNKNEVDSLSSQLQAIVSVPAPARQAA